MLGVRQCQLDALLTFQTPVAGHRHLSRATEKPTPKLEPGLRVSVSNIVVASRFYHYKMTSTVRGALSITLKAFDAFSVGRQTGQGKNEALRRTKLRALNLSFKLFYVVVFLYSLR